MIPIIPWVAEKGGIGSTDPMVGLAREGRFLMSEVPLHKYMYPVGRSAEGSGSRERDLSAVGVPRSKEPVLIKTKRF